MLYTIIWKLSCRFQVKPLAQSEAPVDFEVFAYVIAVNVGQLWDIFRCFREPTASCVTANMSRGCNKLFRSYPEGFRSHPLLEVPVDFVILAYIIAINLSQLWEIFRCFRESTAYSITVHISRSCRKLFRNCPEGFR